MGRILILFILVTVPYCLFSQVDTVLFTSEKVGLKTLTQNLDTAKIYEQAKEYPNPFSPSLVSTSPKIFVYEATPLEIQLQDDSKNIMNIFIWKNILPGAYRFDWWELTQIPKSGIYFFQIITNIKSDTKKVIVVK